ncbi:hypothetical protein ACKFKF_16895 [Phormidesmis sp. 146-12]
MSVIQNSGLSRNSHLRSSLYEDAQKAKSEDAQKAKSLAID